MENDMSSTNTPSVLIVEDEILVAMDIEATFLEASWDVIGPVPDVPQALSALKAKCPDAVCLDMNLNGVLSVPIARVLQERGIPFVVVTGYSAECVHDAAYRGAQIVRKPFTAAELLDAVKEVIS
jgi:DNA-binding response OmpR family regulator